jgi:hypothetical protein
MNNVTTITNPLMQPIQYQGQTYFTGQYFHQMYRNNSDTGGKYKRAGDFMRLIRSIEAYGKYVEGGDIVELKRDASETDADLASVFIANRGNPIMLINATAQVALTHHLDDEVSKNASVTTNRQAAAGQKAMTAFQQAKTAPILLSAYLDAGQALGTDLPMARAVAVEQVREQVGIDFTPLLAGNSVEEAPITPSVLGKELGVSAQKMNKELERQGFQTKDENGDWQPTTKGKKYCTVNPYKAPISDHTGYRILWYRKVLDEITKVA